MKTGCGKVKRLMVDFAVGELSVTLSKTLRDHINVCSECSREFERTKKTFNLVQQVPYPSPPEAVRERIFQQLAVRDSRKRSVFPFWILRKPAFVGAMAVLLLAVVLIPALLMKDPVEQITWPVTAPEGREEFLQETRDIFYQIVINNKNDLEKLLKEQGDVQSDWDLKRGLEQKVANAMKLEEDARIKNLPTLSLYMDVREVWKRIYDAGDNFDVRGGDIRVLITRKNLLNRLNKVFD